MKTYQYQNRTVYVMDDENELIHCNNKTLVRYVRYNEPFDEVARKIDNDYIYDINNWYIEGELLYTPRLFPNS